MRWLRPVAPAWLVALMTLAEAHAISLSSSSLIKMEERKRPATYDHEEPAPPHKRQVTTVNGGSKNHQDADLPGKDELEVSLAIMHLVFKQTVEISIAVMGSWSLVTVLRWLADWQFCLFRNFRRRQFGDRCRNTSVRNQR